GEFTCYSSCENYSIETTTNYYNEDQATQGLHNDALTFCSDKGDVYCGSDLRFISSFDVLPVAFLGCGFFVSPFPSPSIISH
ncbi:MAG: hypothetical protein D3922_06245, partial [Candidatus Electrothrix sp. AR1]|nr:hypothetical protein [Candidatus Electrothrix sp. AR1]